MSVSVWNRELPQTRANGNIHHAIFALLMLAIFLLRFSAEPFNTVFYDEAVNATLGLEIWAGDFSQNATAWTFGSYLYPFVAGAANQVGGETGLRFLSAALSTISAIFVFLTTLRLFHIQAALWATALFGLAGGSISLGQLAVYDSLGLPLLTAAIYCMVQSAFHKRRARHLHLLGAAVCFSLSVLSKYIGILFLPALMLVGILLYLSREDFPAILPIFTVFFLVVSLILGVYFVLNFDALLTMLRGRDTLLYVASSRREIIDTFVLEIGIILPLSIIGLFFLRLAPFYRRGFVRRDRVHLLMLLLGAFFASTFTVQVYQMWSENVQSLWKHTLYTAVFLAPLAGLALTRVIQKSRESNSRKTIFYRVAVALVITVMLAWFIEYGMGRNWGFQHSWPNVRNTVNYLAYSFKEKYGAEKPARDTRILAEQSAVYEYYFDLGANDRDVWSNTFYMEYRGYQGLDAMLVGIRDRYFDYVILDDYYTPDKNRMLEDALTASGYTLAYVDPEPQTLSTNQTISARVYTVE